MKLILFGAPGAGKGTQAELISKKLKIPVVSTGNIILEAIRLKTELGLVAKKYVETGELVPDDIVIDMLKKRIARKDCDNGYILDGYPRNIHQAEALEKMGEVIDKVIDIEVDDDNLLKRLVGRWVCGACGGIYHLVYNPSKVTGVCDFCGSDLAVRVDDNPATIRERLRVYHEQTECVKEHYQALGKLYIVQGQEKLDDTTRLTMEALNA